MSDLLDLINFLCTAFNALFNLLDLLNVLYNVGQFVCWSVQCMMEFGRDLLDAFVHYRR